MVVFRTMSKNDPAIDPAWADYAQALARALARMAARQQPFLCYLLEMAEAEAAELASRNRRRSITPPPPAPPTAKPR